MQFTGNSPSVRGLLLMQGGNEGDTRGLNRPCWDCGRRTSAKCSLSTLQIFSSVRASKSALSRTYLDRYTSHCAVLLRAGIHSLAAAIRWRPRWLLLPLLLLQLLLPLALSATAGSTVHGAAYLINIYYSIIVVFSNCREN